MKPKPDGPREHLEDLASKANAFRQTLAGQFDYGCTQAKLLYELLETSGRDELVSYLAAHPPTPECIALLLELAGEDLSAKHASDAGRHAAKAKAAPVNLIKDQAVAEYMEKHSAGPGKITINKYSKMKSAAAGVSPDVIRKAITAHKKRLK